MEDKKSVKNLKKIDFIFLTVAILIGIGFVFAEITVSTGGIAFSSVNESTPALYNMTIENLNTTAAENWTEINVSLDSGFVFVIDSNGTDSSATHTFSNTSTVLSWNGDGLVMNLTNQSFWFNLTSPSTPGNYNFTITAVNSSGDTVETKNLSITINDTQKPSKVSFKSPGLTTDRANLSQTSIPINISVTDLGTVDTITIKLYNSTQDEINSSLNSSNVNSWFYNFTGLTTNGVYYINATVNDTFGNENSSSTLNITLDTTAPTVSLSKSSSTKNSLTIDITASDATSGLNGICTVSRSGASVSGTTSLTESGLSCGTSYSYIVTCYDHASNSGSSSSTSFSTDACSGGSSLSDSDLAALKAKTYIISEAQFTEGYSKQLAKYDKIKVPVGTEKHIVEINEVSAEKVTIKISSTPQEATLVIGDERKFDVTNDGYYDIYVKLNSIADNKANVSIKSIYEKISEASKSEEQKKEQEAVSGADETITTGNAKLWWIIGIVVVLVLAGIGYGVKKKRD